MGKKFETYSKYLSRGNWISELIKRWEKVALLVSNLAREKDEFILYWLLDNGSVKGKGSDCLGLPVSGKLNASAANSIDWFGPLTFSFDT